MVRKSSSLPNPGKRALGLEDEDWEDMSDDEDMEEDVDESDDRLAEISEAECVLDGVNQREIPLNECFFTGKVFNTVDENVKHMESLGFFIPEWVLRIEREINITKGDFHFDWFLGIGVCKNFLS